MDNLDQWFTGKCALVIAARHIVTDGITKKRGQITYL